MKKRTVTETVERTPDSNVRILTWNILSEELSPGLPAIEGRIDGICDYILKNAPDAAGIQEISETAYGMLAERIGDDYEFVNPITNAGNYSFTGVAYNKKKYRLMGSEIENFEIGNPRIRLMNIIRLEEINGDCAFILLSTHWDKTAAKRTPQARRMAEKVNELESTYGVPVICVGDFNARESTEAYITFMRGCTHKDAKWSCPYPVNLCYTGHDVGTYNLHGEGEESIDHVTVSSGVEVLHYENVMKDEVVALSDHFPVYVDLKLRSETVGK